MRETCPIPTKSSLSPSQQKLLTEMQRINYGRIEGLVVRSGQPVMNVSVK